MRKEKEDLMTKHAEIIRMANDYLDALDESAYEHNKRFVNIYITMLGMVCSGKLDNISLLRFNYFYCKENKSEKKKELNVGNIFNSTRTVKETVDNIIALTELTPKNFFEGEQPYRITVDAILDTKSSVEILVYEFSDEIGNFVLSKNERAITEIEKEYKPINSYSLKEILGDTKVKKSEKEEKLDELEVLKDEFLSKYREEFGVNSESYRLNEKYLDMLLSFYKVLPIDKLNDIKTISINYHYLEPNRAKRTIDFRLENPYRNKLSAKDTFSLFRQFLGELSKSVFTEIDPYLITLELFEYNSSSLVELAKYIYDEHLERFITHINQKALTEINAGEVNIKDMEMTKNILDIIRETATSSETYCKCCKEQVKLTQNKEINNMLNTRDIINELIKDTTKLIAKADITGFSVGYARLNDIIRRQLSRKKSILEFLVNKTDIYAMDISSSLVREFHIIFDIRESDGSIKQKEYLLDKSIISSDGYEGKDDERKSVFKADLSNMTDYIANDLDELEIKNIIDANIVALFLQLTRKDN